MATHSSVLAWRIPGMGEPGGLLSMGSHRVGHDGRDLAAYQLDLIPFRQSGLCPIMSSEKSFQHAKLVKALLSLNNSNVAAVDTGQNLRYLA